MKHTGKEMNTIASYLDYCRNLNCFSICARSPPGLALPSFQKVLNQGDFFLPSDSVLFPLWMTLPDIHYPVLLRNTSWFGPYPIVFAKNLPPSILASLLL